MYINVARNCNLRNYYRKLLSTTHNFYDVQVVFPVAGDYKLEMFCKTVGKSSLIEICTYLMHCPTAKSEWTALPNTNRFCNLVAQY